VDTLLLVVVVAQGVGMTVGLGALVATGLLRPPQNRASLPLGEMVMGAAPFLGLSLTDVLLQRIDILLLSLLGNMQLLGIYSAAYNLVRVAMKVLQSIWRGLYPTLARLYPTSPAQAQRVALRLLWMGLALCGAGALLTDVLATPILRFVYAAGRGATDATEIVAAAPALAVLIWQAPLFFAELYATTWLLVVQRADSALRLALVHLLLLLLLLPLGAMVAGAVGAACGTVAAQVVASTVALWRVWQISMQIEPR
jgi:O-antigen/teichoic acid export membrane protein